MSIDELDVVAPGEYRSNPKLYELYFWLAEFNNDLIKDGVPSGVRLIVLRHARDVLLRKLESREFESKPDRRLRTDTEDGLPVGVYRSPSADRYLAKRGTQHLGTFDTVGEAFHAFKRAHVQHYGKRSPYVAEFPELATPDE